MTQTSAAMSDNACYGNNDAYAEVICG